MVSEGQSVVSGGISAGNGTRRQAAVALVLREQPEPAFLLVRRARSARDPWSGQMALPGGRRDPEDADLCETAVRETREETGVDLDRTGMLLGRLPDLKPTSRAIPRLLIAPFVFRLNREAGARAASSEIAAVYWVPVAVLTDPGAQTEVTIDTPRGQARLSLLPGCGPAGVGADVPHPAALSEEPAGLGPGPGDNERGVIV